MAKKRTKKGGGAKPKDDVYVDKREFHDGLEMDRKDTFEAAQDDDLMLKLDKFSQRNKQKDTSGGLNELYALSGDDSSEDDDDLANDFQPQNDLDSDIEDQEGENEDDLQAWGGKKKHFYGGNPNDPRKKEQGLGDNDLVEAELEEAEGKAMQLKHLEKMDESDFFDTFGPVETTTKKKKTSNQKSSIKDESKVTLDIKQLSKKERATLFQREAPEFSGIMGDFEEKMTELIEKLQPIMVLAEAGKLPQSGPAIEFVQTKYNLILK
jgi:U3 small nucleolar RNA-associated protein 3